MTPEQVDAIEAKCEAATPDRWEPFFLRHGDPYVVEEGWGPRRQTIGGGSRTVCKVSTEPNDYGRANAIFIAAARATVPDLVAALRESWERSALWEERAKNAEAAIDRLRDLADRLRARCP